MVEEIYSINIKEKKIWGILHVPEVKLDTRVLVVFIHGTSGYRIGPHQMYVDFARKLAKEGIYSFRFDFLGSGFSEGEPPRNEIEPNYFVEQIHQVVITLKSNFNPCKIVLFGICSGAHNALKYIYYEKVDSLILLSTSPLERDDNQLVYRKTNFLLKFYFNKIFYLDTWLKFVKGRLNLLIITRPFKIIFHILFKKKSEIGFNEAVPNKILRENLLPIKGALLIHAENDPETVVSLKQVSKELMKNRIPFDAHIIKDANHSFYSIKWKSEIFDIVINWINRKLK